jgi:hypothetical protein
MTRKLSKTQIGLLVAIEAASAALAYRDLAGRPEALVRGKKLAWRIFIGLNPGNSLFYWVIGRRRSTALGRAAS